MHTRSVASAVYRLLLILSFGMGGCATNTYTASGYPSLVKFSPDSKRILYQDSRYDRVYLHHVDTGQTEMFRGHIGCVNSEMGRIVVLLPGWVCFYQSRVPMACFLATAGSGATTLNMLENLPPGRILAISFCSDQAAIQVQMCQGYRRAECSETRILLNRLDGHGWSENPSACAIAEAQEQTRRPIGIMSGGHVYYPVPGGG